MSERIAVIFFSAVLAVAIFAAIYSEGHADGRLEGYTDGLRDGKSHLSMTGGDGCRLGLTWVDGTPIYICTGGAK